MVFLIIIGVCLLLLSFLVGMQIGIGIATRHAIREIEKLEKLYDAQKKVDNLYGR